MENRRTYLCIDLKSFYASVECVERGLDPLTTNLAVADPERTEKTICLAISPSMKALGIHNRCRVFEIPKNVNYIMAVPRMQLYIDYSANIYGIYLKYISKEDIHVYSIDEAFLDVTDYLQMYKMTARSLGSCIMQDILASTGITATCGIGSNLYLAKIALDISAKHAKDHIGVLDEESYCKELWNHKPLRDFWRIGPGIAARLEQCGIYTMGEVAQADPALLYRLFGVDAELLIDHSFGRENVTIADIKSFRPKHNCITSGQVLDRDYPYEKAKLIVKEMADLLCLDLVERNLITSSITLHMGYSNHLDMEPAHGSVNLPDATSSARVIVSAVEQLFDRVINRSYCIRRVSISFNNVTDETYCQYNLFCDPAELERERNMQKAVLEIKKKYGKNAILKGMNLEEGAKTIERNSQIGGHRSGVSK